MSEKHIYETTILVRHLDTFGHVNNATYLELFEEARWDLIAGNGWGVERIIKEQIGPVVLEADCKFRRELTNGNKIRIETQFGGMVNTLVFELHQTLYRGEEVSAVLILRAGVMDLKTRKLIKPTEEWQAILGK